MARTVLARIPQGLRATPVVPCQLSVNLAEALRDARCGGLNHREDTDPAVDRGDGEGSGEFGRVVRDGYDGVVAQDYRGGGG